MFAINRFCVYAPCELKFIVRVIKFKNVQWPFTNFRLVEGFTLESELDYIPQLVQGVYKTTIY